MNSWECPSWLAEDAQAWWEDMLGELDRRGLRESAQPAQIAMLLQHLAQYKSATIRINESSQVLDEHHETFVVKKVSPWFKVQKDNKDAVRQLIKEVGLNEKSEAANAAVDGLATWLARAGQGSAN